MNRLRMCMLACGLVLLLTGCSAFVDQDQPTANPGADVDLEAGHTVGQTFVARHGGLQGLEVWLDPEAGAAGDLVLHLRSDPAAAVDLAQATLPISQVTDTGFYRFLFSPVHESTGEYYYAFLELNGEGELDVGTGAGDAYLDGALYVDHEPRDAQAAFRLVYDPLWVAVDLGKAAVSGVGLLGVAVLLYCVPGWALLAWLWPAAKLSWAERAALAVGLSLALYPLLFLWTDLAGIHLGALYAWGPVVGGLVALAWRYRQWRPVDGWKALRAWSHSFSFSPDVMLIFILALVFGVRLITVRTLDAPMWGDSYQHTMIIQLLLDHGGLFQSWEPYAPLTTFTYHFGFHSVVAAFCWLTGLEATQAVIWVGQILNGLAVLTLYALALRVSGNRWAGTITVLIAGLLSPMPMSYVNWGRYTQLTGQTILPVAIVLTWTAFEALRPNKRLFLLNWIIIGGLALSHYRILIFYVVFVFTWFLLAVARRKGRIACARVIWVGIGGMLLFLPWFMHAYVGAIVQTLIRELRTMPAQLSDFERGSNAIGNILQYLPSGVWLFSIIAVVSGLWKHKFNVFLLTVWWLLLFVTTNPSWIHLPGNGIVSNFALFISVYIPATIFIGDMVSHWIKYLEVKKAFYLANIFFLTMLGLFGAKTRLGDLLVNQHALVTRPDIRALSWIRENTSSQSVFLVNSFFAYDGTLVAGSDAGWWLPLLSGRSNTLPPLTYAMEVGVQKKHVQWVNALTEELWKRALNDPDTLALLKTYGVTHIYIGQRQGSVNYVGPNVLDSTLLLKSSYYKALYHWDRVWIFEVNYR